MPSRVSHPFVALLALVAAAALAAPALADHHEGAAPAAPAGLPDWSAVADVEEIQVVTRDEDGSERATTIWLAVVNGDGYLRTGDTSWMGNIERGSPVALRIDGAEYTVATEEVPETDSAWQAAQDAFRAKYGFGDWLVSVVPGMGTRVLRVVAP